IERPGFSAVDQGGDDYAVAPAALGGNLVALDRAVVVALGVGSPVVLEAREGVGPALGGVLLPVLVVVPDGVSGGHVVLLDGDEEAAHGRSGAEVRVPV